VLRDRGTERLYSLADPNWNVVATANASGAVQERMRYDAFGRVTWLNASFAVKQNSDFAWNRTFTGQVFDSESSLMLYRNRFYHTGLGRFVQRDPIGYSGRDVSLYRYVNNMPHIAVDPLGLFSSGSRGFGPFIRPEPFPSTSPTTGRCRVAVHCWAVGPAGPVGLGPRHCGLTVNHNGRTTTYDGTGGNSNQIDTLTKIPDHTTTQPFRTMPDEVCKCLEGYTTTFHRGHPLGTRRHHTGNSNWVLSCMVDRCGMSINWGNQGAPIGYESPPCKRWERKSAGFGCKLVCVEWFSCP